MHLPNLGFLTLLGLASYGRTAVGVTDGTVLLQVVRTRGENFSPKRIINACDIYPCDQPVFGGSLHYPIATPVYSTALYNPSNLDMAWVDQRPQPGMQPMMMQREVASSTRFEIDVSRFSADVAGMTNAVAALSADLSSLDNDLKAVADRVGTNPKPVDLFAGGHLAANEALSWELSTHRPPVPLLAQARQEGSDGNCTTESGKSAVHDRVDDVGEWPTTESAEGCQVSCQDDASCTVWTWYDASADDWANKCVTWSSIEANKASRADTSTWVPQSEATSGTCENGGEDNNVKQVNPTGENKLFLVGIVTGCILLPCAWFLMRILVVNLGYNPFEEEDPD